jgi:cytochrome c biogenesis protein CcdA
VKESAQVALGNGQATSARGLLASVIVDAQRLVALEVALARQELKELAVRNAVAVGVMAFGGLLAVLGILVALPVMVVELVPWHWQAAAAWAAAYVVIGLGLIVAGKARLRLELPPRTVESLKENKEWALRHVRSNSR